MTDGGKNMIRAFNLKFPTNKPDSDPSNNLIVDLSETEAQRPQPIITDLDEDPIVDLEIDCDDISLWNRIDEIHHSCVEFDSDFDQLDREEESEMEEIDEALGDGFFDIRVGENDIIHELILSTHLRVHCMAHLLQLVIKDGLAAICVRFFLFSFIIPQLLTIIRFIPLEHCS